MPDRDDLLGKADALMARHRPGQPQTSAYAEIPVLDEVVDPGAIDADASGGELPVLTEFIAAPASVARDAEALAAAIREALLVELQDSIDAQIDERLRQSLEPLVERVFEELRGKLRLIAREIVGDAIHGAVERELERRK